MLLSSELIHHLEQFRIDSRRRFLGAKAGSHRSLKRGHGIEFSDYRQYEPGDNPRQIDWRVYARTERLYIKQYQEEQDIKVSIIVDASASMAEEAKWRLTKTVAMSLAYLAIMQQDSVRIATTSQRFSPFLRGPKAIRMFDETLAACKPIGSFTLQGMLEQQMHALKFPGVVILISDFMYDHKDIEAAMRFIRSRNMDGACISILSARDMAPLGADEAALVEDSETQVQIPIIFDAATRQEYAKRLSRHLMAVRDTCRQNDFGFALMREADNLIESLITQKHGLRILV